MCVCEVFVISPVTKPTGSSSCAEPDHVTITFDLAFGTNFLEKSILLPKVSVYRSDAKVLTNRSIPLIFIDNATLHDAPYALKPICKRC